MFIMCPAWWIIWSQNGYVLNFSETFLQNHKKQFDDLFDLILLAINFFSWPKKKAGSSTVSKAKIIYSSHRDNIATIKLKKYLIKLIIISCVQLDGFSLTWRNNNEHKMNSFILDGETIWITFNDSLQFPN